MASDFNGTATNIMGGYQQCSSCFQWYSGYHACQSVPVFPGSASWASVATPLTVADVERIVAKALEDHSKIYLAVIEKLADALAGKK